MSLAPGSRIGPYEVVAPLGAGGMGVVYRARDAHLGREVALKLLPEGLTTDPERIARFEREARLLAQLNHPGIAQIYGVEASAGQWALVLELVEGPTLAERLEAGPLGVEEAAAVALQIAQALEEAHEKGIVHRDLKPQNVKLSREGKVKVLDFGLAKAMDPSGAASGGSVSQLAQSPTLTLGATVQGVILGTAAYMAPEQAKGLAVDKRADVWAFGVVLYEMLTGTRLFAGDTVPETLAGVLKSGIDLDALPRATPRALRELVARCLERDPRKRLRDIGEARIVLERPLGEEVAAASPRSRPRSALLAGAALAALAVGAGGWLAGRGAAPVPVSPSTARFQLPVPEGMRYDPYAGPATPSPDGRRYLFRVDEGGVAVRRLDTLETTLLPESERSYDPIFSPDGRQVLFFTQRGLARVDAAGLSPPQILAPVEDGRGAAWAPDGTILYAPSLGRGLHRISVTGGEPVEQTKLDAERKEIGHVRPSFLPDGRRFLYLVKSELPDRTGLYLGSLDDPKLARRILPLATAARYVAPGFLLYFQDDALVARPFDPATASPSGEPRVLARGLDYDDEYDVMPVGASDEGLLLYHRAAPLRESQLGWLDRSGELVEPLGGTGDSNLDLDPRGTRLAFQRVDPKARRPDVWVRDLVRGTSSRLTSDAPAIGPVWSPDGARLAYVVYRGATREIVVRPAAGGEETVLSSDRFLQEPIDWSPDGRQLLIEIFAPEEEINLALLPAAGGEPVPFVGSRFEEHSGRFSPDGRFVAYVSNESGREEIYLQPVPPTGARWLVSTAGGGAPRWRADGREIYYVESDDREGRRSLLAVAFAAAGGAAGVELGRPAKLFDGASYDYEPAPDGQRFLIGNPIGEQLSSQPAEAIVGFPALFAAGAAGSR
jgi:hypothetical protein